MKGFTLIELMIVIVIAAIITGGGMAIYGRFRQKQEVKLAGQGFYNDLRYTQGLAAANEKPADCSDTLENFKLIFTDFINYSVQAVCGDPVTIKTGALASGVELYTGDNEFTFGILGRGASVGSACLTKHDLYYQIEVSANGAIKEMGFVESC